jgi:F-type H+-transporting ATPase subunit gamma
VASLRDIRRRIRSVRNISQITRAMQMVAASRMRRAQQRVLAARPYSEATRAMLGELSQQRGDSGTIHPLLRVRPERKVAYVVFTSDRGLSGPLNSNIIRRATEEILARPVEPAVITVGRKGQDFYTRRGRHLEATFTGLTDQANYVDIIPAARVVMDLFESEAVDAVDMIYPQFVSTLVQTPRVMRLLPLADPEEHGTPVEFIIEPNPEEVLNALLPRYVETQFYQVLLETSASAHSAQMVAMRNATENAQDLVQDLTLTYNKARQTAITKEITEIAGAAEALARAG